MKGWQVVGESVLPQPKSEEGERVALGSFRIWSIVNHWRNPKTVTILLGLDRLVFNYLI